MNDFQKHNGMKKSSLQRYISILIKLKNYEQKNSKHKIQESGYFWEGGKERIGRKTDTSGWYRVLVLGFE